MRARILQLPPKCECSVPFQKLCCPERVYRQYADDQRYPRRPHIEPLETNLVLSADVTGTNIYGAGDGKVGSIDRVMIDKVSGKVAYAVINFGGIFGIGGEERPVP